MTEKQHLQSQQSAGSLFNQFTRIQEKLTRIELTVLPNNLSASLPQSVESGLCAERLWLGTLRAPCTGHGSTGRTHSRTCACPHTD